MRLEAKPLFLDGSPNARLPGTLLLFSLSQEELTRFLPGKSPLKRM